MFFWPVQHSHKAMGHSPMYSVESSISCYKLLSSLEVQQGQGWGVRRAYKLAGVGGLQNTVVLSQKLYAMCEGQLLLCWLQISGLYGTSFCCLGKCKLSSYRASKRSTFTYFASSNWDTWETVEWDQHESAECQTSVEVHWYCCCEVVGEIQRTPVEALVLGIQTLNAHASKFQIQKRERSPRTFFKKWEWLFLPVGIVSSSVPQAVKCLEYHFVKLDAL